MATKSAAKSNIRHRQQGRLELIDLFRGLTLLQMLAYHALWDLTHLFGVSIPWMGSMAAYVWQQVICWSFVLISGFCFSLGHHHLRRGLLIFGCGTVIMVVTRIFTPESRVVFGVLTLIGLSMLLMIPLERVFRYVPTAVGLPVSFGLFLLTRNIPKNGSFGFERWELFQLPASFRSGGYGLMLLGLRNLEIPTSDYFPLIPWLFLFMTGYWIYRLLERVAHQAALFHIRWKPLCFLGRHTLVIYMAHQPILYVLLGGICRVARCT
ncbi:MAG: DUF1624 domain-containing protein [Ruminococcus sp.]|nr:DUF1624 domain-containing protein [Ruminococcus sp.]